MHSLITDFITTFWTPLFFVIFLGILAYALWPANRETFEELLRAEDAARIAGAGRELGLLGRPDLDPAQHPRELFPKFAERLVVRHDDELRRGVQHTDSIEEARNDESAGWMLGADQVADDLSRVGVAQIRGKTLGRILIDRAKHVLATVGAREVERLRLHRAAALGRPQATRITTKRQ